MMHNFFMRLRRYKALVLAALPFIIAAWLVILMNTSKGWGSLGYFLMLIYSMPVLATMSALSVVFAFSKKDPERRFKRTGKILGVLSAVVFVGAVVVGFYGVLTSMLAG